MQFRRLGKFGCRTWRQGISIVPLLSYGSYRSYKAKKYDKLTHWEDEYHSLIQERLALRSTLLRRVLGGSSPLILPRCSTESSKKIYIWGYRHRDSRIYVILLPKSLRIRVAPNCSPVIACEFIKYIYDEVIWAQAVRRARKALRRRGKRSRKQS
jgi:hypothetical protein